jgi:N,N'-diacetyllegionaminate synthase
MTSWEHMDRAVQQVAEKGAPFAVFQCTTAYPCPPEKLGLNVMDQLRRRYECPVGLSDHSSKIYPGLAAATLGANMLEVHVTLSRECFGPDVIASVTTVELAQLVEGIRFIECALRNPVDKVQESAGMEQMRTIFGRSIVTRTELPAGHRLALADVAFKKPGTGLSPARIDEVINRRLRRSVSADTLILEEDLD